MATPVFSINGHDYTRYVKAKTGLQWSRENTNDEDAGRDESETMHTNVTSHQRKLELTMGPMDFETAMQLEHDLEGGDDGVTVVYPDLHDGLSTSRQFYNTSIDAAQEIFMNDDIMLDNIKFSLISVNE